LFKGEEEDKRLNVRFAHMLRSGSPIRSRMTGEKGTGSRIKYGNDASLKQE